MMRRYIASVCYFALAMGVLTLTHPFWQELEVQRYSRAYWVYVYALMTLLVTLIATVISPAVVGLAVGVSKPHHRIVAVGIMTLVILVIYSHWVGAILSAQEADRLPLSDLNHFFRNFRAITFSFINAPLFGAGAALVEYFLQRRAKEIST